MWWWLLIGCWEPAVTGPQGMAGRVLDATGYPVKGLSVETVEERDVTDDDGAFAVQYKPPDTFVHFRWQGAWYQRAYRTDDDGGVTEIRLPFVRDVAVRCALADPCDAELSWTFADGLTARATARCEPGRELTLAGLPKDAASVRCGAAPGQSAPPVAADDAGAVITLTPPPVPVRVEVRGEEGAAADGCRVRVGASDAAPSGDGFFVAHAAGTVTVSAVCDGRPALPRTVNVAEATEVTLEWSPVGPVLDVSAPVPLAGELTLVWEPEGRAGWMLRVAPSPDGTYALPPLPAGRYRVAIGDPGLLAAVPAPAGDTEPGVLRVVSVTPGDGNAPGGLVGVLRLDEDKTDGEIPTVGL